MNKVDNSGNYIKHSLREFYCDVNSLKSYDNIHLEYWTEYHCKLKSLKGYFKTFLDFKIRFIVEVFDLDLDKFSIKLRNYKPNNGQLTQEFIIYDEDNGDSYVCTPLNRINDGIKHRASLFVFKNGMLADEYYDYNFLELKQQLNKKLLGKERDERYFTRKYKRNKAKAKLGVNHKKSKKTQEKIARMKKELGLK